MQEMPAVLVLLEEVGQVCDQMIKVAFGVEGIQSLDQQAGAQVGFDHLLR